MKKIISVIIFIIAAHSSHAQLLNNEVKLIKQNVLNEALISSKLTGDYYIIYKEHLEKIMNNGEVISIIKNLVSENKFTDIKEIETLGFNNVGLLRDRALLTLNNKDLHELMLLNYEILFEMNNYECSQYIKKRRTNEKQEGRDIFEIAGKLNINKFKNYLGFYGSAFDNINENVNNSELLDSVTIDKVRKDFLSRLRVNKIIGEFFSSGKSLKNGFDNEVCSVGKELIRIVVEGNFEDAKKRTSAFVHGQLW